MSQSSSISKSISLSKLNISTNTDNVTIGTQTLTELLNKKDIVIGEGEGNILVVNKSNLNEITYSNKIETNQNDVVMNASVVPIENIKYSLGSNDKKWKDLYIGPGTINIAAPNEKVSATLRADNNGKAFAEFGFSTSELNIGGFENSSQIVGGWNITKSGTQGTSSFDLVAQELSETGTPTGPSYSLINVGGQTNLQVLTPSQITTNVNNYLSSGEIDNKTYLRLSSSTNVNITGLTAPTSSVYQLLYIVNVGSNDITLQKLNGSSLSNNRFDFNKNIKLMSKEGVTIIYDDILKKWVSPGVQN